MEQIKGLVKMVQEAIENGATTVEEVHREIASKPIEVLKNIEQLSDPLDKFAAMQDQTIGNVYDTIRMVNARVGEMAAELLDKADKKGGAK